MPEQVVRQRNTLFPARAVIGSDMSSGDLLAEASQAYAQVPVVQNPNISSSWAARSVDTGTNQSSLDAWSTANLLVFDSYDYESANFVRPIASLESRDEGRHVLPARVHALYSLFSMPPYKLDPASIASFGTRTYLLNAIAPASSLVRVSNWDFIFDAHEEDRPGLSAGEYLVTYLSGTSSAETGAVLPADETVESTIWNALHSSGHPEFAKLAANILMLQKAIREEEDPSCTGISLASLRNFLGFIQEHRNLKLPVISGTSEGNIYASWKAGANRVFSLHFLADNSVRFVVFGPNEKHPNQTIRLSGSATSDVVLDVASRHGVLAWAAR